MRKNRTETEATLSAVLTNMSISFLWNINVVVSAASICFDTLGTNDSHRAICIDVELTSAEVELVECCIVMLLVD